MSIFKFKFNWNVVEALCPEYQKYLLKESTNSVVSTIPQHCLDNMPANEEDIIAEVHSKNIENNSSHQSHPKNQRDKLTWKYNWYLKPEYDASNKQIQEMNPLQLMPPKSVLAVGSYITFPGDKGWTIQYRIERNHRKSRALTLKKIRIIEKDDKITMIRASYWFDQVREITSDDSGKFMSLIYNKKTRCLYNLYRIPKEIVDKKTKVRYVRRIRGLLLDRRAYSVAMAPYPIIMLTNFVNLVEQAVLKDVPDAFVPSIKSVPLNNFTYGMTMPSKDRLLEFLKYKLSVLVIQHKINTRLDWMTFNIYRNISNLLMARFNPGISNRNQVRKIIPTLRKTKSLKQLLKAIMGKAYSGLALEIIKHTEVSIPDWAVLSTAILNNNMPKSLYHFGMDIAKHPTSMTPKIIEQLMYALESLSNTVKYRNARPSIHHVVKSWVKVCRRFINEGQDDIPYWASWRDMYNMARQLHIRIRPNKLRNTYEVDLFHDNLSEIINRDEQITNDYSNVVFKEFKSPDKMYGKFRFTQLRTAEELREEGANMHHCVATYADYCASGTSIIFSMNTPEHSYATIELNGKSPTYEILQQYTLYDITITNEEILSLIKEWHKDVQKMHKNDKLTYYESVYNDDLIEKKKHLKELEYIQNNIIQMQIQQGPNPDSDDIERLDYLEYLLDQV